MILGVGDPEYVQTLEELMGAGMGLFQYGLALAQDRLDNPRDDITTALMQAEVETKRQAPPHHGRARLVLPAARRRGQRDDPQRDQPRHATRSRTTPTSAKLWTADFEARLPHRGRGDRALGDARDPLPPHRDARRRDRRPGDQGGREGRDVLQLGQPRRARVRPIRSASTSPARRTSTSASAPAARTSASAPTSPGARSG